MLLLLLSNSVPEIHREFLYNDEETGATENLTYLTRNNQRRFMLFVCLHLTDFSGSTIDAWDIVCEVYRKVIGDPVFLY